MNDSDHYDALFRHLNQPAEPSSRFAQDLRARLTTELYGGSMPTATASRMVQAQNGVTRLPETSRGLSTTRPLPRPTPHRSWKLTPAIEIAAVLLLVIGVAAGFVAADQFRPSSRGTSPNVQTDAEPPPELAVMPGGGPGRTGEQPGPGPTTPSELRWRTIGFDGYVGEGAPVVLGQTLYRTVVGSGLPGATPAADGSATAFVQAIDTVTGDERWRHPMHVIGSPAVTVDTVYVTAVTTGGPAKAELVALDAATGTEQWRVEAFDVDGMIVQSPVVAGDTVYLAGPGGVVGAYDGKDGHTRWSSTFTPATPAPESDGDGPPITGSWTIAADATSVYVVAGDGQVVALDAVTGQTAWSVDLLERYRLVPEVVTPIAADGKVLIRVYGTDASPQADQTGLIGFIAALDAKSGDGLWRYDLTAYARDGAVANGLMLVPTVPSDVAAQPEIVALDLETGTVRWTFDRLQDLAIGVSVVAGLAYVPTQHGSFYVLDVTTGTEIWNRSINGTIEYPAAIADGAAFVVDGTGTITAIGHPSGGAATPASAVSPRR